jgi:CRISPR-associated protein Csb2
LPAGRAVFERNVLAHYIASLAKALAEMRQSCAQEPAAVRCWETRPPASPPAPATFAGSSRLLKQARVWESVPYLKNRFDKRRPKSFSALVASYSMQITTEWRRRFPDVPAPDVEPMLDRANPNRFVAPVGPGRALRSTLAFARTRGGRGGRQLDSSGGFFRLVFDHEIEGPIALGWGAHFGLGLFAGVGS